MDRQCSSCGGFCKKSGCERENVKPEPEPVLWAAKESMFMWGKSDEHGHPYHIICKGQKVRSHQIPLYLAPPQREWQGLTENEIKHLWYEACQTNLELTSQLIVHLARNIEAKLKEKNT